MTNLVAQQIAHYQIKALLGQGRIGTVYQAVDMEDGEPVALKVVSLQFTEQPEFRRRFLQEVQTIPRLVHPSIVKVHEAGIDTEQDILYMTMDYVTERSLMVFLKQLEFRQERMAIGEALLVAAQIAEALDYAHQRNVLHRDVRPNVILFRLDTESPLIGGVNRRAVISDFALASVLELENEPFAGTIPYISPEQALKQDLDGRSDLYSLGVVLYQLATGVLPFPIETLDDAIRMHRSGEPSPPSRLRTAPDGRSEVPDEVEAIILKAISIPRTERFQSGSEMAEALRRAVADLPAEMAVVAPGIEISGVQTQIEPPEIIAKSAEWSSDQDRVIITTNIPRALNRQIITIGRSANNDINLEATSVTRRHAQLERIESGWQVRDLGSKNGTFLDGNPLLPDIPEEWLSHQTLRIGPYFFQLQPGRGLTQATEPLDVLVTPTELEVMPGKTRSLHVTITNLGEIAEEYLIRVERLPAEWVTAPEEHLKLKPGERETVTIPIGLPLSKDIMTGSNRFLVVVDPQLSEARDVTVPGTLHVSSAEGIFTTDMSPMRLVGSGTCQLTIRNEGIFEALYTITGRDPSEEIEFGEWRPREGVTPVSRNGGVSRRPPSMPQPAAVQRNPLVRTLSSRPRQFMNRLLSAPRSALYRVLPGLGSIVRLDRLGQRRRGAGAQASKAQGRQPAAVTFDHTSYDKVVHPGPLRTQVRIMPGHTEELALTFAPRKRPFLGRHSQTLPFQVNVTAEGGERKSFSGELEVRPRISTRLPPIVLIFLILSICGLSTILYTFRFNPTAAALISAPRDIDGDGLGNLAELYLYRTNPNLADSDGDTLSDGDEIALSLSPVNPDTDYDGLSDGDEIALNTNARTADTDGDELSDSLEVRILHTDPLAANERPIVVPMTPTPTPTPRPTSTPAPTALPTATAASQQLVLTSIGAQDGFIGVEGIASGLAIAGGNTIQIGDDIANSRQFKGIVSFDTSSIPGRANLISVVLRLRRTGAAGEPYNLGQLHVDIAPNNGFGGGTALDSGDFDANVAVANAAILSTVSSDGNWAETAFSAEHFSALNRQGVTQFRLYFTLPNDGNGERDWLEFASGDETRDAFRPQLVLVYEAGG